MRLREIGDAALAAFGRDGYRNTQVADVARIAGVAPGTIYLYAPSKEALFALALQRAQSQDTDPEPMSSEELLTRVKEGFLRQSGSSWLTELRGASGGLPELEPVLRTFWARLTAAAPAIRLIERCARDWPELAEAFYVHVRQRSIRELAAYLSEGGRQGVVRPTPEPAVAARLIIETAAWFALHRQGDPDGYLISDDSAREAVIDALLHAYRPDGSLREVRR